MPRFAANRRFVTLAATFYCGYITRAAVLSI
jgi:hypothetical protein